MTQRISCNMVLAILLSICLVISLANITHPISAHQNSKKPDVLRWEYCDVQFSSVAHGYRITYFHESGDQTQDIALVPSDRGINPIGRTFAKLGADGWELIGPSGDSWLFKRPIQ